MNIRLCTQGRPQGVMRRRSTCPPLPPPKKIQLEMSAILGAIFRLMIFNPYRKAFFELGENLVQIEELEIC